MLFGGGKLSESVNFPADENSVRMSYVEFSLGSLDQEPLADENNEYLRSHYPSNGNA
jgi:hypothetical protein